MISSTGIVHGDYCLGQRLTGEDADLWALTIDLMHVLMSSARNTGGPMSDSYPRGMGRVW